MLKTLLLIYFLCTSQISCQNGTEIQKTFDLLEQGERQIKFTNETDVILVFGPTGSGKSTFIQWIAGNNSNLVSKETSQDSGEYLIEDKSNKIGSSSVSKTLFPELVTDVVTGTPFYDFPGFSDTRSSSHDIAASFFIKSVMDHVENVKMLFTTSYYTVQEGMDRIGFPALLKNIDDLIGDIDKFKNSIALVVSKVDNIYIKQGRNFVLKPDSKVIAGIANYLLKIKEDFKADVKRLDISDKKRNFSKNAIKIINILLTQEDGEYTRISLFRRPDEEGPLNEIALLAEGKQIVQRAISENLLFAKTAVNDFGFTISDNSKLEIDSLVGVMNGQITGSVEEIAIDVRKHLELFVEPVRVKVDEGDLKSLNLTEAKEFSIQAENDRKILSNAVDFFHNLSAIRGVGEALGKYLTGLNIEASELLEENMSKLEKYFAFFQLFRENPLPVSSLSWAKSFQSQLTYLTESKQFISDKASSLAEEINSEITADVDFISENVKKNFTHDVNNMIATVQSLANATGLIEVDDVEGKAFFKKLLGGEKSLTELVENVKNLETPKMLSDEISKALSSINFDLPIDMLSVVFEKSKEFEVLQTVSGSNLSFPSAQWSNSFKTIVTYIQTQNILTIVEHTRKSIESHVDRLLKSITEELRSYVVGKLLQLEVTEVGDELENWNSAFASICDHFNNETTLENMANDLGTSLMKLNVSYFGILTNVGSLKEQNKYLGFLNSLQGKNANVISGPAWKNYISNLKESFEVELNFNVFIMALFETLSQYNVQSDVSRYDVLDLTHWGEPGHPQGLHVDKSNFKVFMEKVKTFEIEAADRVSNVELSETQFSILNNVLKITLKRRVAIQCPNAPSSTVVLKAKFIKFSDFLDSNGKFKGCGWENIKSLEIYALTTLFIDQNLDALDNRLELSIIATKWEVIGIRRIALNGKDGQFIPKAADGPFPSGHGQSGSPGLPGGSAGAFFGVVSTFIGSENLAISANAGNGGPGQAGGNGANGQEGRTPPHPNDITGDCDMGVYNRNGFAHVNNEQWGCGTGRCHNYKVFGNDAGTGGNAGSCGVGGQAGLSGPIRVISLTESSKEIKLSNNGNRGGNGAVGAAGVGGHHGSNRGMSCRKPWRKSWRLRSTHLEDRGSAPNGVPSSGCNAHMPASPLPAATISHPATSVRNFVKFFIENSNERFVRIFASKVYEQINANPETKDLQNSQELVEDLKMLEDCSQKSELNLVPFYESHLNNIESYAANPKATEISDENKKVLSYLYTASLTQISNLKKTQDSDLVIDISNFLDMASQNVKVLKDLHYESRLISVVETLKNNYKHGIDQKIEEANGLIEFSITPELDQLSYQLEYQMSGLVKEVMVLQSAAKIEIAVLEAKKKALERQMRNKVLGEAVKVFSTVCSFFGPVGAAVGMAINAGTAISGGLKNSKAVELPDPSKLPTFGPKDVVPKTLEIGVSLLDLSSSLKNDRKSIRDVTQGIKDAEKILGELEGFQARIYGKLIPLIEKMGNDLINIANNLESKSSVSLDVIGWQVQSTFKDTSFEIQQFTRGFKVHDSTRILIEKLEEAIKILIKVYDRIQDYQQKQRLAVYMADLSSVSVQQIDISNPALSNSFRDLQISIRSNILLNQYNSVLNAFKQWIFPFAEVFLKDFQLPEHLVSSKTDIEALATTAFSQIEDIRSRIQKYKTTIEDFDKHIYLAQFHANSAIMKPFYVWKNDEHRDMITKLLAGESVLVKADILNSASEKDAIKFNFVELCLKANDSKVQAEIDQTLLNYGVNMTHLGNSNYRYNEQLFTISSASQSLHYSFEKSSSGKAAYGNNVYYKLLSGDIMLSPYTMWEMRLTHLDHFKPAKSFSSLSKFWDKVDLVLEGSGSFVNTGDTKFDVQSYYKVEDSIKLA